MNALIFFLSFLVAGALADNATVQVTVYYESLCSDSIKFFQNKLIPTYTQKNYTFANISKLEVIPFGKANKTNDGSYSCQHGPSECDGNKLHACAIKYITDQQMLLNYIGCLMNETTPVNKSLPYPDPEKVCTNQAGNVLVNITNCYKNQEGSDLININENKTTTFVGNNTSFGVPFISFNNKYDTALSQKAQDDYRKTLCSQASLTNDYCSDYPKNGAAMLSSSVALIAALLFSFYARL